MTQAEAHIRINGQDEILSVATLAALLEEKAVDTEQRGIAVALNGAVVPRADQTSVAPSPASLSTLARAHDLDRVARV